MNNWIGIGRLTRDPEVRETKDGLLVATFNIAIDRPGDKGETDFPRITCFGKTAENVGKYMKKGRQVAVQGYVATGSYVNQNGEKVYTTGVTANRVEFLGSKDEGQTSSRPAPAPATPKVEWEEVDPYDIPF